MHLCSPQLFGMSADIAYDQRTQLTVIRFMGDCMVDIYVGEGRKKFRLHRNLLCKRSDYFQACFGGQFKEAEAQELALPEDSVDSFELLSGWLYGAPLTRISSTYDLLIYIDLVILAQKLCLEHLRNETMDHILIFYRLYPCALPAHTIHFIYENTSTEDSLRKFIIQYHAWSVVTYHNFSLRQHEADLLEGGGEIAIDFTAELAKAYAISKGNQDVLEMLDPREKLNCFYHQHSSTPFCSDLPE